MYFQGQDIWSAPKITHAIRFHVGLAFQYPEYQLFEETVYKDIAFGPTNMGLEQDEIDRRVREAAGFVGLGEALLEKSPFELSGGQKRRAAMAGVFAMEPGGVRFRTSRRRVLIRRGARAYWRRSASITGPRGTPGRSVSHSMEEIARNAGRIVVLGYNQKHIVMDGTPADIFSRAEELESIGLGVPEVTRIAMALRRRGLPIDGAVYTQEALRAEILRLRGGRSIC